MVCFFPWSNAISILSHFTWSPSIGQLDTWQCQEGRVRIESNIIIYKTIYDNFEHILNSTLSKHRTQVAEPFGSWITNSFHSYISWITSQQGYHHVEIKIFFKQTAFFIWQAWKSKIKMELTRISPAIQHLYRNRWIRERSQWWWWLFLAFLADNHVGQIHYRPLSRILRLSLSFIWIRQGGPAPTPTWSSGQNREIQRNACCYNGQDLKKL